MNLGIAHRPNEVSEYECREAARFNNYNWTEWLELTWWNRAKCVAFYRASLALDAHVQDAIERQSRRGRRG